jgi:hypothetical protein
MRQNNEICWPAANWKVAIGTRFAAKTMMLGAVNRQSAHLTGAGF